MLDNNPIENCVRPLAIGRKNYMFCGNHDAAEEAAIMYTMMGCCKLAGVDFRKWTTHFLTHMSMIMIIRKTWLISCHRG